MATTTTPSVSPFLFCADVQASLDFLVDAFGLEAGSVHKDENDKVFNATARLGECQVFLSIPHPGKMQPPGESDVIHSLVLAYVPDVDAVFERAKKHGATVEYEPQDMDYGQRECGLRDLDGHFWSIATLI